MQEKLPVDIPFHSILNHLDVPVIVVDTSRLVVYATPSAEKTFDYEPGKMHGTDLIRVVPGMDIERTGEMQFEHATAGAFRVSVTPIRVDGTTVGNILSIHTETGTTPVEQTDAYKKLTEYMEAVFHASSDGIWLTDGKGVVLNVNNASESLNSISAVDVVGKHVKDLVRDGIIDRSATLEVLKKKRRVSILQHVTKTGRQLIVTGTPTFDEKGRIRLIVLNERDITDLNEMRTTLAQTRKAKEKAEAELTGMSLMELKKGYVVAESPAMRKAMATAQKLAQFETSEILLMGDSGTGKGLLAKFIHDSSPRRGKPFIQVNCATLPETLFEAELFGYEKGAFTGASEQGKSGLFELAAGGTFFLDEVGEIPLEMQAKLLNCLDDHEYYPLGASKPRRMDCIIVAATNRDLAAQVKKQAFRRDLLYRLNTFTVYIPPLKKRPEDVFELVNHYLKQFNAAFRTSKRIGPIGMRLLQKYPFPGNVRELIGIIKKAVVICEEEVLDQYLEDLFDFNDNTDSGTGTLAEEISKIERKMLIQAMDECKSTREMAEYLGTSQPTVVRKMQRHKLSTS
ncbi:MULTISPECIES: sigma 54-interacting transcriptional regulator [unclassified Pseudodesulfovibrio]|uniref:sigma 54-interacting transcriptional regulator n=1 Tax=unclassified Pseudodesulfovibrio TaxID=2661612 RepID=UPI000FEBB4BA|nr:MULTISPECIES: sigma 54-interacting transcriptional regulator [unclassified Pseudodesulfovibrio]MCJ2165054.1 sigma 54-interacting transcriptional regulator [Pseudodesulfovibrio sp. S3-i]RWU03505.1 PAS domain-containing protein [Pseudodesulfovibrio sp. S3]